MTHTKIQSAASFALQAMNCPLTPARIEIVAKRLDVVGGDLRVVGLDGNVRTRNDVPLTIPELVEEILLEGGDDARTLRWLPIGRAPAAL